MIDQLFNTIRCLYQPGVWLRRALSVALTASMTILAVAAASVFAQNADQDSAGGPIADVTGPGQAVPQPASQCPRTLGCQYAEQTLVPSGYRMQSLQVCGANCTSQYWVASIANGQQLLEIDPVRGGVVLAVGRASAPGGHPPVRVVMPMYGPSDPACCPSGFSDTTYTWDAASSTLVAGEPIVTPADQFPGFDAARQELMAEGWIISNV
jgi:hypothetical protein